MPGEGSPGRRSFVAVAVALALSSIVPALGLARSSPPPAGLEQAEGETRAAIRLPVQRGASERFSEIVDRSRAYRRAVAEPPRSQIEPGLRPVPDPSGAGPRVRRGAGPTANPPAVGTSFLGAQLSDTPGFVPPDSMGSVGPDQVVVAVNGRLRVFDKAGNLQFDVDMDAFFESVRNGAETTDPQVEYDRLSQRWFVVLINLQEPSNRVLIAASSGPTISNQSSFSFFSFGQPAADSDLSADYPTLGVDRSALYIGTNNFAGDLPVSTSGFVVRKSALLDGTLTVFAIRNLATPSAPGPWSPQGVKSDDPSSTEGYFIGVDTAVFGLLDIRRVSDPGGTPTISGNLEVAVPETTFPIPVPAQGTTPALDAIDDRLFEAMISRDPVTGAPHLWTAHHLEVDASGAGSTSGGRDGARWYDIVNLSGKPALAQAGTVFDAGAGNPAFYWFPSIAANDQGQAVLGSSVAGVGRFAGIALAQRFRGDPVGTMSAPVVAQAGLAPYNVPTGPPTVPQRWGDYSQTVIDPNDNMTFWTFQEYTNATNSWGVRVIQVRARPPATPSAAAVVRTQLAARGGGPAEVPAGRRSVRVRITGTSSNDSAFFDPGPDPGGPGFASHISASVGGGVRVRRVTYLDPTHVIVNLDTRGARLGPKSISITNPDGQAASAGGLLKVVDATPPQTRISGPKRTADRTPTFRLHSNEPRSRFKCRVDRGQYRRCRSPKTLRRLEPGRHVIEAKAIDRAGNVDPTAARRRFTILP